MRSLLFRADGSKEIGMGHVTRDVDLAKCLKERYDKICFLTKNNTNTIDYIHKNGFKTIIFPEDISSEIYIENQKFLENERFNDIILDVYDMRQNEIDFYKRFCNRVICFTDETYKLDITADIIFAFSPNQKEEYYSNISGGKFYVGSKYFPLNPIFSNVPVREPKENIKRVLVTLGGSDLNNLTIRVLDKLSESDFNFEVTAVLGHGFGKISYDNINKYLKRGIIIKKSIENMYEEMLGTDLGICSAGNTLLEFMCLGIPALVLPQTIRENEHAEAYEKKGSIFKVSDYGIKIKDADIIKNLKKIVSDKDLRNEIRNNALSVVDGKGIFRIADILA